MPYDLISNRTQIDLIHIIDARAKISKIRSKRDFSVNDTDIIDPHKPIQLLKFRSFKFRGRPNIYTLRIQLIAIARAKASINTVEFNQCFASMKSYLEYDTDDNCKR